MLFNYFLIAVRNILKQRGYAIVNMLGLAIGLASALFILLYVRDEMTFDTMHPKAADTYRIGYNAKFPNGEEQSYPASPGGWDNYIKSNYEGVSDITSFSQEGMPTSIHYQPTDKIVMTEDIFWAESNYNKVLYMPVVKGSDDPLKEINSLILTESAAHELFGDEDPLNKTVSVSHMYVTNGQKIELMITAIVKDPPSNSHLSPKYVANILALKPFIENLENAINTDMGGNNNGYWTQSLFVCADPNKVKTIRDDLQKKSDEMIARNNWTVKVDVIVQKITNVHFDKRIDWSVSKKSADKTYMYVFICIAVMILVVAGINYINLSTARSASRAREIGLRKTFGGVRLQLFVQFMMESFVLVLLSTLLAVLLVIIFIPQFNDLTGKTFSVFHIINLQMTLIIGAVIIFVTLLAGSYPALFVSKFVPAEVLKGKFSFRKGSNIFRQFLTTVQFVVAVIFLIGTIVVVNQMDLMRNSKLNEAGKQIVSIRYGGFPEGVATNDKFLTFKNAILEDPEIEYVTLANHLPRLDFFGPLGMEFKFPEINDQAYNWNQLNGDYDFPRTFGLKIIAGRDFDHNNVADSNAVIVNQAALKALNMTADQVIGKTAQRPDVRGYRRDTTLAPVMGLVIGVVEDFPYKSMHKEIEPLAISPRPHGVDRIIHVRLPAGKMGEKLKHLDASWKKVFPSYGFDYWFVDEEFGRMYENETKVAGITEKFSWLAILITCVGLYGLASFMSEQRTKEIGIRKTMGASNVQILILLLSVFGKLLLISCLIAVPIAYFLSSRWLEGFVYRTDLSLVVFGGSVLLITVITLVTVGYESLKASLSNPVKALRHE